MVVTTGNLFDLFESTMSNEERVALYMNIRSETENAFVALFIL